MATRPYAAKLNKAEAVSRCGGRPGFRGRGRKPKRPKSGPNDHEAKAEATTSVSGFDVQISSVSADDKRDGAIHAYSLIIYATILRTSGTAESDDETRVECVQQSGPAQPTLVLS